MKWRWVVIDTKFNSQVGKFATRYGAMVFAEKLKGLPGRYTVVEQNTPSQVVGFEPQPAAGRGVQ
jgi:hypothetical protein